MAVPLHNYGRSCSRYNEPHGNARRHPELSDTLPPMRSQFFYSSALTIDDPLSSVPMPTAASVSSGQKAPARPFSSYDNAALEVAWQGLMKAESKDEVGKGDRQSKRDLENLGLSHKLVKSVERISDNLQLDESQLANLTKIIKVAKERRAEKLSQESTGTKVVMAGEAGEAGQRQNVVAVRPPSNGSSSTDEAGDSKRKIDSPSRAMFHRFHSNHSEVRSFDSDAPAKPSVVHHGLFPHRKEKDVKMASVPVGISCLHLVEMPDLQVRCLTCLFITSLLNYLR